MGTMIRLSTVTPRMWLILAHDLLATALAVVVSFLIRFEEGGLEERWTLLVALLPPFVLYAGVVYALSGLYRSKWRFTSLPDLTNIVRATTVLAVTLLALDYVLLSPNLYGTFFFGKITIALYWLLQIAFLAGPRIAYRYFRYTRTLQHAREGGSSPILVVGRTADADVLLRAIESGAVTRIRPVGILSPSPADRGQAIRGVSVLGGPDDLEGIVADLASRGTAVARIVLTPSALSAEAKPETVLMRARRLGLATSRLPSLDDGGEALRLAPVQVEDLLLRPRVRIDYRRGAFLGVGCQQTDDGCAIFQVHPGSCAEKAGIQEGDLVLQYNGKPVASFEDLTALIAENVAGDKVTMKLRRFDEELTKELTLGEWE